MRRPLKTGVLVMVALGTIGFARGAEAKDFSLGLGAGTVDPQEFGRAPWFTANLRWKLGKKFLIEPEGGYWKKTETVPGVETSIRVVNGGVNILYPIVRKGVDLFVGGGLGVHVIRSEQEVVGLAAQEDTEVKQALHLLAGFELKAGALRLFGAARFDTVADLDQSKLYGGLRIRF